MYHITSDGTKIYYRITRKSPLFLVFVHGWTNNWTTWKKEIDYFSRKGYSTLAFDLRGHGQSDKPNAKNKYTLQRFASDIHELLLKEKIHDYVLLGHSMGGMISLTHYKRNPFGMRALVLSDTTAKNVLTHKRINKLQPFIQYLLDFMTCHEKIQQDHLKHIKDINLTTKQPSDYWLFFQGLRQTPLKCVFTCLESMMHYNVTSILKKIKIPVLLIEGSDDKILPAIDTEDMYRELKHGKLCVVPHAKHFVNLTDPKIVDRSIAAFLKEHKLTADKK